MYFWANIYFDDIMVNHLLRLDLVGLNFGLDIK